ncbi:hypothetical protein WDW37_09495 [Bdellovibrionota bacterium FG-1]
MPKLARKSDGYAIALAALAAFGARPAQSQPTAIVVDGGDSPVTNYCRYYDNIDRTERVLTGWNREDLVAGGPDNPGPTNSACDAKGSVKYDAEGLPILEHRTPSGPWKGAATLQAIEDRIRKLRPGEPVLLYFTDHGSGGDGEGDRKVVLWGQMLTVSQLRKLTGLVPSSSKLIMVNDQCFGGGMLDSLFAETSPHAPRPHSCGFAAATRSEMSYSGGGFMEMADRVVKNRDNKLPTAVDSDGDGQYSFGEVQRYMQRSYATESTPVASSDIFLQRYLDDNGLSPREGRRAKILSACIFEQNGVAAVTHGWSPMLTLLLHVKLERLRSDLANDYAGAGVSPGANFDEIKKERDRREDEVRKIEKQRGDIVHKFKDAFAAWMTEKHPELMKRLDEDEQQQLLLQMELATGPTAARRAQIQAELVKKGRDVERDQTEINRHKSAVTRPGANPTKKEFNAYASAHGDADVSEKLDQATTKMVDKNIALQAYRRLYNTVATYNAISAMIVSGDSKAMSQYLDMLDCENTPIRPVPEAQGGHSK